MVANNSKSDLPLITTKKTVHGMLSAMYFNNFEIIFFFDYDSVCFLETAGETFHANGR